jgi:transposase
MGTKRKSTKKRERKTVEGLLVIRANVAGIDIGSQTHWVCGPADASGERPVRTFRSTTPQLEEMARWLKELEVESVAMESTHVYWIPPYELLESQGFEVQLVNSRHVSSVAGRRKTDKLDCEWLQRLHSCGLLAGSFRPGDDIVAIRSLLRQRARIAEQQTKYVQWMQKALDQMNIQIHRAVTDLTGHTGMAILRAIIAGERDPRRLAELRDCRCKKSVEQIAEHLAGNWRPEHLFNLAMSLELYDHLTRTLDSYDERILAEFQSLQPPDRQDAPLPSHPNVTKERAIRKHGQQPLRTTLYRFTGADLARIDGIGPAAARLILAELGNDLSAFPDEKHFVSWLRLAPSTPYSGDKPLRKRRPRTGSHPVASLLRMCALSLKHSPTALGAEFRRLTRRKGGAVAVFAIARKLAQFIYRMLQRGQDYVDVGEAAYEERYRQRRLESLKENARTMGYELVPKEPSSSSESSVSPQKCHGGGS